VIPDVRAAPRPSTFTYIALPIAAIAIGALSAAVAPPFALAIGVAGTLLVLTVVRPQWGIASIILLIPTIPILPIPSIAGAPLITPTRALLGTAFLGVALSVVLGRTQIRGTGVGWGFAVWLFAVALSVPTAIDPQAATFRLMSEVFEAVAVVYLVVVVFDRRSWWLPLTSLVTAGVLNASLALSEIVIGTNLFLPSGAYVEGLVSFAEGRLGLPRLQGTYSHPSFLASSLTMLVPIALGLFVIARRRLRWLLLAAIAIMSTALFLTFTRAAWYAVTGASLAVFVSSARQHPRLWIGGYWMAASAILLTVVLPNVRAGIAELLGDLFATRSTSPTATTGYRLELTDAVVQGVAARPLTGFGAGNFADVGLSTVFAGRTLTLGSPDNHLLRVLLETGYIGLLAFTVMVVVLFVGLWRAVRSLPVGADRTLGVGVITGLIGFIFVNLTISALAIPQVAFVFWAGCGALLASRLRTSEKA
jgi:O-antigen ligase